jgi:hypothetical protein
MVGILPIEVNACDLKPVGLIRPRHPVSSLSRTNCIAFAVPSRCYEFLAEKPTILPDRQALRIPGNQL